MKKGTDAGSTIISSSGAVRSSSSFFSSSDERSASGIPATDLSVAIDFFALLHQSDDALLTFVFHAANATTKKKNVVVVSFGFVN